ncbi:MAG: hypothetical protein H6816_12780 [Phycisphaerales bacterium]|nr:hypothetical protein [Phycisphaerales bacterium]
MLPLVAGGCTQSPPDQPVPDDGDTELPLIELSENARALTPWETLAAQADTNGAVSKQVALEAFALTMGDIPGVEAPADGDAAVACGSQAVYWISQHADELSADELAAVQAALNTHTPPGGESARIAQGLFGDFSCTIEAEAVSADDDGAEAYRTLVDQELAKLAQALGRPLGIPVYITLGIGKSGSSVLAWASPQAANSCSTEPATSCRVEIFVNREQVNDETELRRVLAHELTHCYQSTMIPPVKALRKPHWLLEGFPEYLAGVVNPTAARDWFTLYTSSPLRNLYTRTYDAVGFYFHLRTLGVDVDHRYPAAFEATDNSAAFAHLIAPMEMDFGDTWASSFALDPLLGEAWTMVEAPLDALPNVPMGTLVDGKRFLANPGEAGVRIAHVDFDADVVGFKATGQMSGRIAWDNAGEVLLPDVSGLVFCAKAGGCTCPPGTTGSPPQTPIPANGAVVAVAGTSTPTTLEIGGYSLDDYCRDDSSPEPPPAEGVDPCIVGTWVSDPWILPGPIPALDGTGGNNATLVVHASGQADWDFNGMQPITAVDSQIGVVTEQYTRGTATGHVAASDGHWEVNDRDITQLDGFAIDNIIGEFPLAGGPGLFVALGDGGYTCSGSLLSYTTSDPVTDDTISVTLHKQ